MLDAMGLKDQQHQAVWRDQWIECAYTKKILKTCVTYNNYPNEALTFDKNLLKPMRKTSTPLLLMAYLFDELNEAEKNQFEHLALGNRSILKEWANHQALLEAIHPTPDADVVSRLIAYANESTVC